MVRAILETVLAYWLVRWGLTAAGVVEFVPWLVINTIACVVNMLVVVKADEEGWL